MGGKRLSKATGPGLSQARGCEPFLGGMPMTERRGKWIGSRWRGHFPAGVAGAAGAASNLIMALASL